MLKAYKPERSHLEEILSYSPIQSRLEAKWVLPDYWISQFLTGHGGFRAKLHSHGMDIDPLCPCGGVPETAEHIIVDCTAYEVSRATMLRETGLYILTESDFPQLVTAENYPYYKDFVYGWKTAVGPAHFTLFAGRGPPAGRRRRPPAAG